MRAVFQKIIKTLGLLCLLSVTWIIAVYHMGVATPPKISGVRSTPAFPAQWIDKSRYGMHQLVLSGPAYDRGVASGSLTQDLLYRQEKQLISKLREIVPYRWILELLELVTIRWFWGIEDYLEPWMTEEMLGVSQSVSHEFDSFADRFTRQIAYHGIHEIGQMSVDQGADVMGCTVVGVPHEKSWIVGRNFDFEGGRIFDSEKIMKWVFPDQGYPFVSIIWAGMVGGVTGINQNGIYISINAAGSRDFKRLGTPSTLVLVKVLQFAKNASEAIEIIKNAQLFITDIFMLLDGREGKFYRIEKSPLRTEVIPVEGPTVVSNHLAGSPWVNDSINIYRQKELTSEVRERRGQEILAQFPNLPAHDSRSVENFVLKFLRDKGYENGAPLAPGNRRGIDGLISIHSVIYNPTDEVLYVSQGPAVSGPFTGFDLRTSFQNRTPRSVGTLPRDPDVSDEDFLRIRAQEKEISTAAKLLKRGKCEAAKAALSIEISSSGYYAILGDYYLCRGDLETAKNNWRRALELYPAYAREVRQLEEKLSKK